MTKKLGVLALIYQRLGNGINPELAYRFIDSGFDMEVLNDDQRCSIHSKA
ncbi:TPA: hypothetical protein ACJ51Q_001480 [Streptococcus suis]|nr:hypothetical protein [Streptococcus suis]HEM5234837.1 hypothetical protein [Streptococcus suis]